MYFKNVSSTFSIDSRVKILGYVVKEFAKICDIGDASRGSLSSYAYILMLIYYLQQVSLFSSFKVLKIVKWDLKNL